MHALPIPARHTSSGQSGPPLTLLYPRLPCGEPDQTRPPEEWFRLFYDELRRWAGRKLCRSSSATALSPTALVHEAWLRLAQPRRGGFHNSAHFLGAAFQTMRCILIDGLRRKHAVRRGGGRMHLDIEQVEVPAVQSDERERALHEALDRLAAREPRQAKLVRLRFFSGLTLEQAARTLGISAAAASRHWTCARAWLHRELTARI